MKNQINRPTFGRMMLAAGALFILIAPLAGCLTATGEPGEDDSGLDGNDAGSFTVQEGDYGDAPDDRDDPNVSPQALFPTRAKQNGAHHLDTTQSALGYFLATGELPVSPELDATDPNDPDGVPNLDDQLGPDQDRYDDGFLIGILPAGQLYQFPVVVSVAAGGEDKPRYVNILADWNADLEWRDTDTNLPEWVVQNHEVRVAPGTSERIFMPEARLGAVTYGIWYRVTLSEQPIDPNAFPQGWDGSGEFEEGETEDYIFHTQPLNEVLFDAILYHPDIPEIPGDSLIPPEGDDDDDDLGDDDDEQCDPVGDDDDDDDGDDDDDDDDGNDDPDGDGQPGIDKKNIGKLRKVGPNHYRLVLCKGKTWQRGFEWETYVRNGVNSNPFAAGLGLGNDPGTVTIHAREVGTTRVSFEGNTITFPIETAEWVTVIIDVTVIDCDPKCVNVPPDDDGGDDDDDAVALPPQDPASPFAGMDRINMKHIGKLLHQEGNTYFLVLCCTEEVERGFEYMTHVRNATSSNPTVATLSLQNDPGRIRISPQGEHGVTTLTFEANVATFPFDSDEWSTITIHVMVIECPEEYYLAN